MPEFDLLLRTAAFTMLLLLALVLFKEYRDKPSGILGAFFAFGSACDVTWPLVVELRWTALYYPLHLLSLAVIVAFWLLAKSLFDDAFRWRWWYLLVYGVLATLSLGGHYLAFRDGAGLAHWIVRTEVENYGLALVPMLVMFMTLLALAVYAALKDWRVDLVQSRRRARMAFVLIMSLVILVTFLIEFLQLGTPRSTYYDILSMGLLVALLFGFCVRFLSFRSENLAEVERPVFPSESPEHVDSELSDAPGAAAIQELERLMTDQQFYKEESVTIGRVAERIGIKEYMLRRLINGHLGYRNFNQFLNLYRIKEASRQLVAPETRHLPVLSIALDVGYRSLTPFNKAFKDTHGVTPTDFRSSAIRPG